jgi:hypothetical protein
MYLWGNQTRRLNLRDRIYLVHKEGVAKFRNMGRKYQQDKDHNPIRPYHINRHGKYLQGSQLVLTIQVDNTVQQDKDHPFRSCRNQQASRGLQTKDL